MHSEKMHKICTKYSEIFKTMQNKLSKINSQSSLWCSVPNFNNIVKWILLTSKYSNDWIQNKLTFY